MVKKQASTAISQRSLFDPPPILEGEDAAAHDELSGRVCAAVKPVDVIDEMLVADVVALQWEVLRWRRLKSSLIRARGLAALENFLGNNLKYDLYWKQFVDELTTILQVNGEAEDSAQTLAHACAEGESDAVDKVRDFWRASMRARKTSCTVRGPIRPKNSWKSTCGANRAPSSWSTNFLPRPA
jgi:hypothetical protein